MASLSQESIDEFRTRTAIEAALNQLDASWAVLVDLRINGPTDATAADYVALHPRRGIALVDVILSRTGDPAGRLRKFLQDEGFFARFPGRLPIVRLVLKPIEAASFGRRVHAAFAAVPPLGIADPAWLTAVNSLLVPNAPSAGRTRFPRQKRPTPQRRARRDERPTAPRQDEPEPWEIVPERWPDRMAGATPLKRQGRKAASDQPATPRSSADADEPAKPAADSSPQPGFDEHWTAPKIDRPVAPPPAASAPSPAPTEATGPAEQPAIPVREPGFAEKPLPPQPLPPRGSLSKAGRQILSIIPFAGWANDKARKREARRATGRAEDFADGGIAPVADSAAAIESVVELLLRRRNRGAGEPQPPQLPSDGAGETSDADAPPESTAAAFDRLLFARREDAVVAPPAFEETGWWRRAAAAIIVIAVVAGGGAWLGHGDVSSPWGSGSRSLLPTSIRPAPNATAELTSPSTAPGPSVSGIDPSAPNPAGPKTSDAIASDLNPPRPDAPSPNASSPGGSTAAPPSPANPPAIASEPMPNRPAASTPPSSAPPANTPPANSPTIQPSPPAVDVAAAPEPPAPSAGTLPSVPKANPPPDKAGKPAEKARPAPPPPSAVAYAAPPPPRPTSRRPEPPESRSARGNGPPVASAPEPSRKPQAGEAPAGTLRGPPIDLADLPRGEPQARPAAPSEPTAPAASSSAPNTPNPAPNAAIANAGTARAHGPTMLLSSSRRAAAEPSASSNEVCRSYTATKTLLGQPRQVNGLACRDGNGGWQIITELSD